MIVSPYQSEFKVKPSFEQMKWFNIFANFAQERLNELVQKEILPAGVRINFNFQDIVIDESKLEEVRKAMYIYTMTVIIEKLKEFYTPEQLEEQLKKLKDDK